MCRSGTPATPCWSPSLDEVRSLLALPALVAKHCRIPCVVVLTLTLTSYNCCAAAFISWYSFENFYSACYLSHVELLNFSL